MHLQRIEAHADWMITLGNARENGVGGGFLGFKQTDRDVCPATFFSIAIRIEDVAVMMPSKQSLRRAGEISRGRFIGGDEVKTKTFDGHLCAYARCCAACEGMDIWRRRLGD